MAKSLAQLVIIQKRARILGRQGDFAAALPLVRELLSELPSHHEPAALELTGAAETDLAAILRASGHPERAVNQLQHTIENIYSAWT